MRCAFALAVRASAFWADWRRVIPSSGKVFGLLGGHGTGRSLSRAEKYVGLRRDAFFRFIESFYSFSKTTIGSEAAEWFWDFLGNEIRDERCHMMS